MKKSINKNFRFESLSLEKVSYSHDQSSDFIHDVDFFVQTGEWLFITGESGSGKTTFLTLLSGLSVPTRGGLLMNGVHFDTYCDTSITHIRSQVFGFVFQTPSLFPALTVRDNLYLGQYHVDQEWLNELIHTFELEQVLDQKASLLSGGQAQRISFIRSILHRPQVLFLDEPISALDPLNAQRVMRVLQKLYEQGTTLVMVTHQHDLVAWGTRQIVIEKGQIIEDRVLKTRSPQTALTPSQIHKISPWKHWFPLYARFYKTDFLIAIFSVLIGILLLMVSIGTGLFLESSFKQIYDKETNMVFKFSESELRFLDEKWTGFSVSQLREISAYIQSPILFSQITTCSLSPSWSRYGEIGDNRTYSVSLSVIPRETMKFFQSHALLETGSLNWSYTPRYHSTSLSVLWSNALYKKIHQLDPDEGWSATRLNEWVLNCPDLPLHTSIHVQGIFNQRFHDLSLYGDLITTEFDVSLKPTVHVAASEFFVPFDPKWSSTHKKIRKNDIEKILKYKVPSGLKYQGEIPDLGPTARFVLFIKIFAWGFSLSTICLMLSILFTLQISKIEKTWQWVGLQRILGLRIIDFCLFVFVETLVMGLLSLIIGRVLSPVIVPFLTDQFVFYLNGMGLKLASAPSQLNAVLQNVTNQSLLAVSVVVLLVGIFPSFLIQNMKLERLLRRI